MSGSESTGIVYLIGAGPGDPGLITVRALECLRRADVVIYDYLANPEFLREAPAAEHLYVGKSRGCHHTPQEEINALLADRAGQGKIVARLKGGDPYVFGRGGEEAQYLARTGIPFEVVPGVTAAFAAAAYAGIPLTHRDFTTSLGLVTGHENPAKKMSSLDWEKLATGVGTLVFYMGMANLSTIATQLMGHGRSPQTPVALIRWATTPRQETLIATLSDVVEKVREAGFKPPAVIIVGEVVDLRQELRWFDNRPLFGKTVLVTRAADQAGEFAALLAAQGAQALECPTIRLLPPESWQELDAAVGALAEFDWIIFTSANAVRFFFDRLNAAGLDARAFGRCRICTVGPKTAAALHPFGLKADLISTEYKAEGVVAAFGNQKVAGCRILFPRANRARDIIPPELTRMGAEVIAPVAYRNGTPETLPAGVIEELEARQVSCATFTSSSTAENLVEIVGQERFLSLLEGVVIACIGPITAKTCRELGLKVDIEPREYTLAALTEAIVEFYRSPGR
ncbi:MAG: uroporphyrinogen-III C-methyltransferase [Desulfuromonadales bacterium]